MSFVVLAGCSYELVNRLAVDDDGGEVWEVVGPLGLDVLYLPGGAA